MVKVWKIGYYLGVGAYLSFDYVIADDEQGAIDEVIKRHINDKGIVKPYHELAYVYEDEYVLSSDGDYGLVHLGYLSVEQCSVAYNKDGVPYAIYDREFGICPYCGAVLDSEDHENNDDKEIQTCPHCEERIDYTLLD